MSVFAPIRALLIWLVPASLSLALLATESAAQGSYPAFPVLPNFGMPSYLLSGDFTGDGLDDLAVASPGDGRIRVHAGSADGWFLGGVTISVGGVPSGIFADDFDRDGDLDLAWIDEETGAVGVLLFGAGNPPPYVRLRQYGPDEPTGVVLADADSDGWKDLIAAHGGADGLVTYPNLDGDLGAGQFEPVGDRPDRLVLLNHAGGPSIALRQSGRLSRDLRLTNLADGSRWSMDYPDGGEIFAVDIDGDGEDELLLADESSGQMSVRRHDGGNWTEQLRFEVDADASGVAVAEVSPGQRRLAIVSRQRRRAAIYAVGAGSVTRESNWYCGGITGEVLYEDIDRDGAPDVVVAQSALHRLQIMPPLGAGFYAPPGPTAPDGARAITQGFGTGGELLLAVPGVDAGQVGVYEFQNGEISEPLLLDAASGVRAVRFGELDGINDTDIVSVSRSTGVWSHLSDGVGGYSSLPGFVPEGAISDLVLVDVVGGPALDVVLARFDPPALVIHEGLGDGSFHPDPATAVTTLESPVVVRTCDLDLDGRLDIVALGFDTLLTVFLNKAGISLAGSDLLVDNAPRDVGFGRFNADAYPDMVTMNEGTSEYAVVTSLLPGVYTVSSRGANTLAGASRLEVADFNLDGVDDLAVIASSTRTVGIHLNQGTAEEPVHRFSPPIQYELADSAVDLAVPEIDGDGQPDLIGLDGDADVIVVRRSDPLGSGGSPTAALQVDDGLLPRHVEVLSSAEFAHDLRLIRQPGSVVLPLVKVAPGVFEALDDTPASPNLAYVVEDRRGHELDRLSVGARIATDAPDFGRPRLLPVRYESGRAILRMRAADGVVPVVRIFDLRGRRVAAPEVVADGGGWFEASWAGTDFRGRPVSRGRYLVRASLGPVTGTGSIQLR